MGGGVKNPTVSSIVLRYKNTLKQTQIENNDLFLLHHVSITGNSPDVTEFLNSMSKPDKNFINKNANYLSFAKQFSSSKIDNSYAKTNLSQVGSKMVDFTLTSDLEKINKQDVNMKTISASDYKFVLKSYEDAREQEIEEYSAILEKTNQEIKELESLNIQVALFGTGLLKGPNNPKIYASQMDAIVASKTKFTSYSEYKQKLDSLKNDKNILEQAISKTEELKKCASYSFLPYLEEYQNYTYEKGKINSLTSKNVKELHAKDISPLEKIRAISEYNAGYLDKQGKLGALLIASEAEPELAKIYNYLYETEGLKSANTYLESMENTINQINGKIKAEKFLESLKNEKNIADALNNHIKTTGKGLGDGVESFFAGVANWFVSSSTNSAEEYESMYILDALQNNPNYNKLLDNNYEISQSIGNMLPSMAISVINPLAGTVSMGTSAGGNSYHGALVEGQSAEKAVVYGVLSGMSEATLEKLMGGIPGLSDVNVTGLKTFAQTMVKEGVEEGTQEYVDALLRAGVFKDELDLEETTQNAVKSAIYGAIVGGIMNTPSLIVNGKVGQDNSIENIDFSTLTFENLENLDKSKVFQGKDGIQKTYTEMQEYVINKEIQDAIKKESLEGNNVGEVGDNLISKIETNIQDTFNQSISVSKSIMGFLLSPFDSLGRFIYKNVSSNNELSQKILENGLYHLTSLESAQKIIDSGYVKTGHRTSYGAKKTFFFAGEPTLNDVVQNINNFETQKVAVKFNVNEDTISNLVYRKFTDKAIANYGDFHFNANDAKIVYLGLQEENGRLVYKEINESDFKKNTTAISNNKLKEKVNDVKSLLLALSSEYDTCIENINDLKAYLSSTENSATYDHILDLIREIEQERLNLHPTELYNLLQVKEAMARFDLEKFIDGKTDNQDGVVLITPSQTIMTETHHNNGNFKQTIEAILEAIDSDFQGFSKDSMWFFDKVLDNKIRIEMSNNSSFGTAFLPTSVSKEQIDSLKKMYNEMVDIKNKTGKELSFSFANQEGGLDVFKLVIEEAEKRVKSFEPNEKEIILENHDPNQVQEYFDRVQLANEKELYQETFNELSDIEQQDYIEKANIEQLNNLVEDSSLLNPSTIQQLEKKILQNQDAIFLGKVTMARNRYIDAFVTKQTSILQKLKNESLISLLNSKVRQEVIQEINRRIDNGNILIDRLTFSDSFYGSEVKDSEIAFAELSPEYQEKIIDLVTEKYKSLPSEIKDLSISGNNRLFSQAFFITSYINGNLDSEGIRILNELQESAPQKLKDVNYHLLNKEFINDLGEDYLKLFINDPLKSSKILSLHDNYPNVYKAYLNILNSSSQDDSLFTFYPKINKVLDFMFNNAYKLSFLDQKLLANEDFVNYALYEENVKNESKSIKLLEYSPEYRQKFEQLCDEKFLEAYNEVLDEVDLYNAKNAYFSKYFSMSYLDAKRFIAKYDTSINSIEKYNKDAAVLLKYLKYIDSIDNYDVLKNIYDTESCKLTPEEMLSLDDRLRKAYAITYVETLSKTNEKIQNLLSRQTNVETMYQNGK